MDLSSLGVGSLGLWTRAQALALVSAAQIDHLVATRTWQVVWSGVYADGGFLLDAEQRALAAVLAAGGAGQPVPVGTPDPVTGAQRTRLVAVAVGRTAARVWGFPLIDDEDPATGSCDRVLDHVSRWTCARDQRRGERRLVLHQQRFGPRDLVRRSSGLWLTSPTRTLVDCARLLTHEALVCAIDDALHRRLVDAASLEAAARSRRGLPGGPAFQRAVALADGRAEAPTETLARLILLPVLPGLVPQVELFDAGMRLVARFDLGDEEVKLAVEADGVKGHGGPQMVAKDRRRDRRTGSFGWATERTTWFEVRRQQAALRERVLAAHEARRPAS